MIRSFCSQGLQQETGKQYVHTRTRIRMFAVAWVEMVRNCKQYKCSINRRENQPTVVCPDSGMLSSGKEWSTRQWHKTGTHEGAIWVTQADAKNTYCIILSALNSWKWAANPSSGRQGGARERIPKSRRKLSRGNGHARYLGCDGRFMGAYMCQNLSNLHIKCVQFTKHQRCFFFFNSRSMG